MADNENDDDDTGYLDDEDWSKISVDANKILKHGLLPGLNAYLGAHGDMSAVGMSSKSLWLAVLVIGYVAKDTAKSHGMDEYEEFGLVEASMSIGADLVRSIRGGGIVDVVSDVTSMINTRDIGDA